MKDNNIPFKNYIFLAFTLILSIIVVIYFYVWYGAYEENTLSTPIMDKYLTVIKYNELEDYLIENKDAIIYVSILENEDIRIFEKKFKNVVNYYSLNSSILYLDLSSEINDDKLFNSIKEKYRFKELPCIITYHNGTIYDVYDIKNNNYNVDNLTKYLINEGVIND